MCKEQTQDWSTLLEVLEVQVQYDPSQKISIF
jgi:hypothetical protein